jgi:quercetin dioxygenase-like cupin family protein
MRRAPRGTVLPACPRVTLPSHKHIEDSLRCWKDCPPFAQRALSLAPFPALPPCQNSHDTPLSRSVNPSTRHHVAQLPDLAPVPCPCGQARRAFVDVPGAPASVHLVEIAGEDARVHYHRRMTEIYVILEGEGHLELDGVTVPVRPMSTVMIKPGCRHRAVGNLKLLNLPVPAFDPSDEWFD